MDSRKCAIFAFQLVKPILQTITHLIQSYRDYDTMNGFSHSVLVCKMHGFYCTIRKNLEYFHFSSGFLNKQCKRQAIAMVRLYENKPLQNTFKRI